MFMKRRKGLQCCSLVLTIKILIYFFHLLELTLFEVALCGEPSLDRPGILSGEITKKGEKSLTQFE